MYGYAKSSMEVIRNCEKALKSIQMCRSSSGDTCSPNKEDFKLVTDALSDIYEFCELRDIKI